MSNQRSCNVSIREWTAHDEMIVGRPKWQGCAQQNTASRKPAYGDRGPSSVRVPRLQTEYPETQALLKVQGVGHITALTFVLT
ncbi:MAG TPA: hypothetical protein VK638_32835, partial [Edaphobacter sp.]|nr:hypothetical protein [Edaphobacter sp.]